MKLNLNYEDLAAVISLCLSMGRIDNDFTSKELEAIANGVLKEYDFSGKEELFQQYFDDANEMDFDDVIRHISQFGDNEKQFVADMLNATMRADDKITTDEASLYQMCVSAFCLPVPAEPVKVKTSDPNIVIPGFLCYDYTLWSNEFTDGIAFVHQAPVGVNFHNWMFECCGTKTFTTAGSSSCCKPSANTPKRRIKSPMSFREAPTSRILSKFALRHETDTLKVSPTRAT